MKTKTYGYIEEKVYLKGFVIGVVMIAILYGMRVAQNITIEHLTNF